MARLYTTEFEAQLDAEIADLEQRLAARRKVKAALSEMNGSAEAPVVKKSLPTVPVEISQTDAIKSVLAASGGSMRVAEIVKAIKAQFNLDVPKANIGPTLTRLKNAGFVTGTGGLWKGKRGK